MHTQYVTWVHTVIDERRHHHEAEQVVGHIPYRCHLDSVEVNSSRILPSTAKHQPKSHIHDITFYDYFDYFLFLSIYYCCGHSQKSCNSTNTF